MRISVDVPAAALEEKTASLVRSLRRKMANLTEMNRALQGDIDRERAERTKDIDMVKAFRAVCDAYANRFNDFIMG